MRTVVLGAAVLAAVVGSADAAAADLRVKREAVFAFAQKPAVTRQGDRVTIRFTSQAYCDATVAIEDRNGRILRYLASGVLGPNAPEPFQKGSFSQTLVWDGKDELGQYIDDQDNVVVRVSLGLKPRFERTLFWSPQKMVGGGLLLIKAAPEGVYVLDQGHGTQLRLFDHEGHYLRTVYPFPAEKMDQVIGLKKMVLPPGGEAFPLKWGLAQNSLLTGNDLGFGGGWPTADPVWRFTDFAVQGERICLVGARLNFLATDGSTGGLDLTGPRIVYDRKGHSAGGELLAGPVSAALSPDGRTLYLAGYTQWWSKYGYAMRSWQHNVDRIAVANDGERATFVGVPGAPAKDASPDPARFRLPAAVATDAKGRVYVADHYNDRIQVFGPDGAFHKSVPVERPARLSISPKTGEIYVFSWHVWTSDDVGVDRGRPEQSRPQLTLLGPFEDPQVKGTWPIDIPRNDYYIYAAGREANAEVDFFTDPPTIWLSVAPSATGAPGYKRCNARLLTLQDGKLVVKRNFDADAHRALLRPRPPRFGRTRLYVNHATGALYLGEATYPTAVACKSFYEVVKIDPQTGAIAVEQVATDPEDMGFDLNGLNYARTYDALARFDPKTWHEVPYDYGLDRVVFHGAGGGGEKVYDARGAVIYSGSRGGMFHLGGLGVNAEGTAAVVIENPTRRVLVRDNESKIISEGKKGYVPPLYPGRTRGWEVHVFDRYGRKLIEDAVPGLGMSDGIGIDRDHNLYILVAAAPYFDGQPYVNDTSCTLVKLNPNRKPKPKLLSTRAEIPMGELRPKHGPDMYRAGVGDVWAEDVEWTFGGVGIDGKQLSSATRNCSCFANSRIALDYYARSFCPEVDRYRIVVLDTNGNVITRFGRYGNIDDGMPLVTAGGPPAPRSIGGDEVAIMHVMNLAVDTDKRLFAADIGNQRILSVRLDYHTTERVALKDVNDRE